MLYVMTKPLVELALGLLSWSYVLVILLGISVYPPLLACSTIPCKSFGTLVEMAGLPLPSSWASSS